MVSIFCCCFKQNVKQYFPIHHKLPKYREKEKKN